MATIDARFRLAYGSFQLTVDLNLPGTGITVIFGHSGSGKTSLLRCIAGLQKATQGFLTVNGAVWQDSEHRIFLPTYQRPLGYVFQEANLFPHLTVQENLRFGLKRTGQKISAASHLDDMASLLGISHLMDRHPANLSGGEQQRVAIVRALVLKPELLLMDEPLAALDLQRKQDILPYLSQLHQQLAIPILYVTHSQQELAQLADFLVLMDNGRAIAQGVLDEVLHSLDLPLAQDKQAASVWLGIVSSHDDVHHLSCVDFHGHLLYLPKVAESIGTPLRVQIHARDVSITLQCPKQTSILNILPGVITGIAHGQPGQTVVQLQIGTQLLLSHITSKSVQLLDLEVGMAVYVQIKGTSLLT